MGVKHTASELEAALEIMKSTQIPQLTDGETEPLNQEEAAQSQAMMEPGSERPSESEVNVFPIESWGSQHHKVKFHYEVLWELLKITSTTPQSHIGIHKVQGSFMYIV